MPIRRIVGIIVAATALIAVLSAWLLRDRTTEVVEIKDSCNTFVSEFSPNRTPALRNGGHSVELIVSFTPAKVEEARRVMDAVAGGTTKLHVVATNVDLKALRVEPGLLILEVQGLEDAKSILRQLCFEEPEVSKLAFSRAQ
jgi:hypothetical protein